MSADAPIAGLEAKNVTQTPAKFNELRVSSSGHPHDDAKKTLSGRLVLAKSAERPKDAEGKRDEKDVVKENKKKLLLVKTTKVSHGEHRVSSSN